jgi:hypothetical protein
VTFSASGDDQDAKTSAPPGNSFSYLQVRFFRSEAAIRSFSIVLLTQFS